MIALYSESGEYLRTLDETQAHLLVEAHQVTCVRDRAGTTRRLYEIACESRPLVGAARARAVAGYIGSPKYTYLEAIEPHVIHMIKRYLPHSGRFVRWPADA